MSISSTNEALHATSADRPRFAEKLDNYLDDAGIDLLIVTSKHNVRYLLGGHHHHFFDYTDAIGVSRYLPILVYPKGGWENAAYFGNRNEKDQIAARRQDGHGLWVPNVQPAASGTLDAMGLAIQHIRALGLKTARTGIEAAFLPWDAASALQQAFPDAVLVDALRPLERLRAVKTPAELALLERASDLVVDAMIAVAQGQRPGARKRDIVEALRLAEVERGLVFDYGLLTVGTHLNRAPTNDAWDAGHIMSMDSGGNLDGYIGDLCRMAILGEPDSQLQDLLAEVRAIQDMARSAARAGVRGGDVFAAGQAAMRASPSATSLTFVAHGMGLVSHEAPRLTASGPIPYPASDAELPLEAGMILSVETTMHHPTRGFIKLEDTIAVTDHGSVGYGDRARDWICCDGNATASRA
ncbi:Xaa-Pro peptidase family protein [soil metagenome]